MVNMLLVNKIISFIPSKTLKDAIKKTNHEFSLKELIQIAIQFAPTRDELIDCLNELKITKILDEKLVNFINKYLSLQECQYQDLIKEEQGYVYEVIVCRGGYNFISPTYKAALVTAKAYIEEFVPEEKELEVEISRRRLAEIDCYEGFEYEFGYSSYAFFDKELNIKRLGGSILYCENLRFNLPSNYFESLNQMCGEDLELMPIKYPNIFKHGDLVYYNHISIPKLYSRFSNYASKEKEINYGINTFDNEYGDQISFSVSNILLLEKEEIKYKTMDLKNVTDIEGAMVAYDFIYVDFGYLEKADLNNIPYQVKVDYEYALMKLKEYEDYN